MPASLDAKPMLAVAATLPDDLEGYAVEYKWDGMRALATCGPAGLRITSRNGLDNTKRFPELAGLASAAGRPCMLDGEIVAFDARGRPDFGQLQLRLGLTRERDVEAQARVNPVRFFLFDLISLAGQSLVDQPYVERRRRLEALGLEGPAWATPRAHVGAGHRMLAVSRRLGLEGVVAKRLTSRYLPGERDRAWLKIRNRNRQEFVVGGWSEGVGARAGSFGALLVGHHAKAHSSHGLRFAGKVGSGYTEQESQRLAALLRRQASSKCPFDGAGCKAASGDGVHWVRPRTVVEVEFSGLGRGGLLRHPSYKGTRTDKAPRDVVWEQPDLEIRDA